MKNGSKNAPVGTAMRREIKKGNSAPKEKSKRSTPRFYEVKIRITADDFTRGQPYFQGQRYLARVDLLEPVIREMYQQGKLAFLNGGNMGGEN